MKDLQSLSERELLILIADRQKRDSKRLQEVETKVEKHERFKNTLVGTMLTSLAASITACITAFFKAVAS